MIFGDAQIDAKVKEYLSEQAPDNHDYAEVEFSADQKGATLVAAYEKDLGGEWGLTGEAYAGHEWAGSNDLGFKIRLSKEKAK